MKRLELVGRYQGEGVRLTYGAGGWSGWPFLLLDELEVAKGRPLLLTVTGPTVELDPSDLVVAAVYLVRELGVELDPTSRNTVDELLAADVRLAVPAGGWA